MVKQKGGLEMRKVGEMISKEIPGLGFALIVFPFGGDTRMTNYISNAQRADMIKALEETLHRWKNNEDFPTPETN
jgi:hypothetical protein